MCNPAGGFIELNGRRILECDIPPVAAVLCETVVIPARTEVLGQVQLAGEVGDTPRVVEPSPHCWDKFQCMVGRSVVSGARGTVLLRNPTPDPITLKQNTRVGTAYECTIVEEQTSRNDATSEDFDWSAAAKHLSQKELQRAKECIDQFRSTVSKNSKDTGRTRVLQHRINTGAQGPIRQAPRRLPAGRREEATRECQRMLEAGVISPSQSPWCSPVVLVRKKDGSMRFCVDFRRLNEVTVKDSYPLPRIDSILDSLAGATLFTALDLQSGYWQVEVAPEDRPKTAFSMGTGLYEFNVLPFGVCNGPATFQRLMDIVLDGLH